MGGAGDFSAPQQLDGSMDDGPFDECFSMPSTHGLKGVERVIEVSRRVPCSDCIVKFCCQELTHMRKGKGQEQEGTRWWW